MFGVCVSGSRTVFVLHSVLCCLLVSVSAGYGLRSLRSGDACALLPRVCFCPLVCLSALLAWMDLDIWIESSLRSLYI